MTSKKSGRYLTNLGDRLSQSGNRRIAPCALFWKGFFIAQWCMIDRRKPNIRNLMAITPVDLSVTNITATSVRLRWVRGPWTPAQLFLAGEQGAFYISKPIVNGAQALFQDAAGTVPVTADGDPNGLMIDQSPNSVNAAQSTSAARPTYNTNPDRLSLDKVDDTLIITVPSGGWTGTMVLATDQGTASYGISIPAGDYAFALGFFPGDYGRFFPGTAIVGAVFRDGAMTAEETTDAENYFVENGAAASYGAVASFYSYWQGRSELTSFPLIDTSSGTDFSFAWQGCSSLPSFPLIDTSSGTDFSFAWQGCSSLPSFPLIDTSSGTIFIQTWAYCSSLPSFPLIDTSSGTNFGSAWQGCSSLPSFPLLNTSSGTNFEWAWQGCSSLTSFPANFFDNIKGGNFGRAFDNTNLSQASIDGILVSLVTSGIATGTRVFDQSGGSAPSATGKAAIDTLRSRGWTIKVTGGY
jgi:hypothetical protein